MSRRKIQFHPDSKYSEEKSFVLIGINLFFGLAALLLVFIILGQKHYGPFEILGVVVVTAIPIVTNHVVLKGDKASLAYDRASQIVNYTDPVTLVLKNIENISKLSLESQIMSDSTTEIYRVTLSKGPQELSCLVKNYSGKAVPNNDAIDKPVDVNADVYVDAFIDPTSNEVVAFIMEDTIIWAIPTVTLKEN